MLIELTDLLRCPADHPEVHCVMGTGEMMGRSVMRGMVGCPVCKAEYRIEGGVARFGSADAPERSASPLPEASALHAFLGLTGPGGYVVLVGSAASAAAGLAGQQGGVHFVGINAPAEVSEGPALSLLESSGAIPLRTASVRGVIVGPERATPAWLAEAVRVLLPGLRLVVLSEGGEAAGIERLATGPGVWVGQKRSAGSAQGKA